MTYDEACNFTMPFGNYRGLILKTIGEQPGGLVYLDGWRNEMQRLGPCPDAPLLLIQALGAYLNAPPIKARLERDLAATRPGGA